jgi:5-methylcytosine-specific restriction enzyme A
MKDGYVLEYVTHSINHPNRGFEDDPEYLEVAEEHPEAGWAPYSGPSPSPNDAPLREILGENEFDHLQDMWAQEGKRRRWSVAFPIVESFEILGKPRAEDTLGLVAYRRLFQHSSGTLRSLNDEERSMIADLALVPKEAVNAWIAIEDEIRVAERSDIPDSLLRNIDRDLSASAMEGMTEERKAKIRRRAAWLANRFALQRSKGGTLFCDKCGFDPAERLVGTSVKSPAAELIGTPRKRTISA